MNDAYAATEPTRASIESIAGPVMLEFGTPWCGYCRAAQPLLEAALADHPLVNHMKIADGPRRPLGRSFGVTLWPTLIFLRDGRETARLVRPRAEKVIRDALAAIDAADAP
jgi:thioredoxin 1